MPGFHLIAILIQLVLGIPFSKALRVILLGRESWESSAGSFLTWHGGQSRLRDVATLLAARAPPFCPGDPLAWSILRIFSRREGALPHGAPPPLPSGRFVGSLSNRPKDQPLENIYRLMWKLALWGHLVNTQEAMEALDNISGSGPSDCAYKKLLKIPKLDFLLEIEVDKC